MSTVNVLADPAIPKSVTSSVPRDIPDRTVPVDNAAIRKKKTSTEMERLEQDNQRMEERLNALRETLARQKEKRASANRTSVWRAGQSQRGSLSSYASDVLAKKNAAMQKTRYGGIGQEVEERRRLMDPSCKANTSTGSLGLAKSIDSLNGERRASLPTSALSPKAPSSASRKPSAPSVNPPPSVSRPARMWRVPSALDNHPPMASSPPGANYSNSRRHSEQVYTHQQDPYSNTRRGSVASVVAIPPTPPRDSEAAQDFLMQAAEEGMGDAAMFAFTSPLIYDQQESPSDSKTDSKDATEPSDSLLQGAFDEEESHRSFVSALEEWRNERAALKAQATAPTGVFRSRRVSTMLYQNAAAPPSQASENSTYVHRSLPRTLMVPSTPGQSHGDVSSLGNAPSDGEQGSMYLPIHNNEYGAPLSARPRSGSLASIGKSISNLTTSLGAVLGISPPGHAESQDVSILPITVSDHLSSHGVVTSGRESASTTPVRTPINSPRRSFAAQPPPPQLSITPVTATANSQHNSPIKHAHSPQRSSLLATSTYDEQASHNSFLSALNQWRGTQEKHTDQEANVQDSQNAQADFYGQGQAVEDRSPQRSKTFCAATTDSTTFTNAARTAHASQVIAAIEYLPSTHHNSASEAAAHALSDSSGGLTYMEKLLLDHYRVADADGSTENVPTFKDTTEMETSAMKNSGRPTIEESNIAVGNEDNDLSDDESLDMCLVPVSLPTQKPRAKSPILAPRVHSTSKKHTTALAAEASHVPLYVEIQDVTNESEADILRSCAGAGYIDCIPSDRLIIVEPED